MKKKYLEDFGFLEKIDNLEYLNSWVGISCGIFASAIVIIIIGFFCKWPLSCLITSICMIVFAGIARYGAKIRLEKLRSEIYGE